MGISYTNCYVQYNISYKSHIFNALIKVSKSKPIKFAVTHVNTFILAT